MHTKKLNNNTLLVHFFFFVPTSDVIFTLNNDFIYETAPQDMTINFFRTFYTLHMNQPIFIQKQDRVIYSTKFSTN